MSIDGRHRGADGTAVASRLDVRDIAFAYDAPLLDGVSLALAPGQCVVLLGANGAGKTTLLRLAAGLLTPARGAVEVDGRPIGTLTPSERVRTAGYLSQSVPGGAGFAVYEVVLMGLYALLPASGWEGPAEWRAVVRALRRVSAEGLLRRPFAELSGGEKRRVLLARALVAEPRYLLLDEPLSALDPGFVLQLTATLKRLAEQGTGLMISTHRLLLARTLADRVVCLKGGAVIADGPPAQAMTPAVLAEIYGTEAQVWSEIFGASA